MAYIFEYAFLCKNLYQARKIRDTLTTDLFYRESSAYTAVAMEYYADIGDELCFVSVNSHSKISGASDEKNGWWVSVVPIDRVSKRAKWTRGGVPDGEKAEAEAFVRAVWDLIKEWDYSYQFIYASQGVEVSGFGDEAHIRYLLDDNHNFNNGALLGSQFLEKHYDIFTPRDYGWKPLGCCFQQEKLGELIE